MDAVIEEIHAIQRAAREGGGHRAAALADDRPPDAQGLDRPEGDRRQAGRGHLALPPGPDGRGPDERRAPRRSSRTWLRSYRPEELFDANGALVPELAELPPRSYRRMSANPHANGGLLLRDLALPDFRDYAVDVPAPGRHHRARRPASWAPSCATSCGRNRENFRVFGPDETASNRLGAVFEVTDRPVDGGDPPDRRAPRARRPGDGGPLRAPVPGLAGGLPADRPARPVQLLRGVHPHRRLDVQPARQVAEGDRRHPVAAADRVAQLPPELARLAPGPQRLQPPGPGLHRPRREQEGRASSGSTCRPTRTRSCRSATTACAAATTSTSSWPASSRRRTGCRWTRRSSTARAGSGSGTSPATTRAASRTS